MGKIKGSNNTTVGLAPLTFVILSLDAPCLSVATVGRSSMNPGPWTLSVFPQ